MTRTLPLEEFEKFTDSLYEAIIIIAKRARQINEEQKQLLDEEDEINGDSNDYDADENDSSLSEKKYTKLPKPTTTAINEMLEGKLRFVYPESSEDKLK